MVVGIGAYVGISSFDKRVLAYEQQPDTYDNLLTALQGEVTATQGNYKLAEKTFRYARDAEASHAVMFTEELELLNETGLSTGGETYFICPVCGRAEKGSASLFCPVCGTLGFMFEKF